MDMVELINIVTDGQRSKPQQQRREDDMHDMGDDEGDATGVTQAIKMERRCGTGYKAAVEGDGGCRRGVQRCERGPWW